MNAFITLIKTLLFKLDLKYHGLILRKYIYATSRKKYKWYIYFLYINQRAYICCCAEINHYANLVFSDLSKGSFIVFLTIRCTLITLFPLYKLEQYITFIWKLIVLSIFYLENLLFNKVRTTRMTLEFSNEVH